jgi:hypothetical protein
MNKETTNIGPVIDANPVFDSVAVGTKPMDLDVTVSKTAAADQAKIYPGEKYSTTFAFKFTNFTDIKITPPYNLVMTLAKPAG